MKRSGLLLLLTASIALASPAFADVTLLDFSGFDYDSAGATSTHYLDVGDGWKSVGFIVEGTVDPGLLGSYVDFTVNEYTYYIYNLVVDFTYFDGVFLEADFSNTYGGRTRYYEDSKTTGTPAVYGTSPPNGTAPSTFIDGTVALGGKTGSFVITYNFGLSQGDFSGTMDLDEGSDLSYIPSSQRPGWILGGLSGNHTLTGPPNPSIPAGYDHQVTGRCVRPNATPTTHKTWGAIKSLYR